MNTEYMDGNHHYGQNQTGGDRPPEKPRKKSSLAIIVLSVLLALALIAIPFAGAAGYFYGIGRGLTNVGKSADSTEIDNQAVLDKLEALEGLVDRFYLFDIDKDSLEEGIYDGYIKGLGDKYAEYYSEEDYQMLQEEDSGKYQGIGVTVMKDSVTNYVVIEGVFKKTPAEEAGLLPGDYIISVNGKETVTMELQEVVSEIRREDKETAELHINRNGEELDFSVKKTTVEIATVEYRMMDDQIGYIEVTQFIENTDELFKEAVDDLEKQNMKSLIIDLRDNGGGWVDSCVNMLSRILPKGKLLTYTKDKNGQGDRYTSSSAETVDLPIILLVNENSASASEIFAGCLKDYGLARLVGTKTYGKGIVQSVIPLSDGTAVKFTISKYYTPNGNNIHEIGFEPDVEVEMTQEEKLAAREDESKDKQLKKAVDLLKE